MSVTVSAFLLACGPTNVDVTRVLTPHDAANAARAQLRPVAVLRGGQRIALPADARLEGGRVVLPKGIHVHKLGRGDVIETDDDGRIVGVRTGGDPPIELHFVPGTAVSPSDSDEVRGQLVADAHSAIELGPTDRVEMRGSFAPDAAIPGGAHVESTRSTGLLIAGIVVMSLGYLPSAYIGLVSPRSADRILLLPAAGPWIDLANRPKCTPPPGSDALPIDPCTEETASRWALIAGGGLQAVGFVLGAFGLPTRTELVEPSHDKGVAATKTTFSVLPTANAHGSGVMVVGTF